MPHSTTSPTPRRPHRTMRPFTAAAGVPVPPAKAALNYLAVCVVVIAVVWASLAAAGISLNFDFVAQYRMRIWDGFCMTVGISAASLVASLALGVLVAAGQGARFLPLRYLCDFSVKSFTDFLIILAPLRKCRNCLEYQAFPAFCVSEDTPHIMAYRSLIWRSKVVKA